MSLAAKVRLKRAPSAPSRGLVRSFDDMERDDLDLRRQRKIVGILNAVETLIWTVTFVAIVWAVRFFFGV